MKRSPIVHKSAVPVVILSLGYDGDAVVRILKTGWKDKYSVIHEDAYDSQDCGHEFMTTEQIKEKYQIEVEGYFL